MGVGAPWLRQHGYGLIWYLGGISAPQSPISDLKSTARPSVVVLTAVCCFTDPKLILVVSSYDISYSTTPRAQWALTPARGW